MITSQGASPTESIRERGPWLKGARAHSVLRYADSSPRSGSHAGGKSCAGRRSGKEQQKAVGLYLTETRGSRPLPNFVTLSTFPLNLEFARINSIGAQRRKRFKTTVLPFEGESYLKTGEKRHDM